MILNLLTILLGFAVLLPSSCRLISLHVATHRPGWIIFYVSIAVGAIAAIGETCQGRAAWPMIPLLLAGATYLLLSRKTWRGGPPLFTRRDGGA